jgi:hypothetical protein
MDTSNTITLAQYRAYREKGAPDVIPTMCILTIKPDEILKPHHAKARIVALGNHKDKDWSKKDKYAPVLRPNTMRLIVSMAIEQHRKLRQGGCKNAFCQGILPPDKITILKPPIGDPDAKKKEYWLLNGQSTASIAVLDTGMSRLNPSWKKLGSAKMLTTRASSVEILSTHPIP